MLMIFIYTHVSLVLVSDTRYTNCVITRFSCANNQQNNAHIALNQKKNEIIGERQGKK